MVGGTTQVDRSAVKDRRLRFPPGSFAMTVMGPNTSGSPLYSVLCLNYKPLYPRTSNYLTGIKAIVDPSTMVLVLGRPFELSHKVEGMGFAYVIVLGRMSNVGWMYDSSLLELEKARELAKF